MFGYIEDGKPDEEWFHYLPQKCIQFDANEILGIRGSPCYHIVPVLLNDGLAFIPCGGTLHFHQFQSSLHEFVIGGVSQ